MTTDFEITDKELREVYELLTKEQLIEALIIKHKECMGIAKNCVIPAVRRSLPLTNQKLWGMAKVITDKQKTAKEQPTDKVDWNMLEEMWFDWLEEELFGNDA